MLAKILTIIFIFVLVFILFNLDKIEINNIKNKKNDKYHLIVNNSKYIFKPPSGGFFYCIFNHIYLK